MNQRQLEIHLEELGEHSWLKSLLNTLGGSHGSAQFRFVARPPGPDQGPDGHVMGASFPVMRAQDLDDRTRPNAWAELAEQSLDELDHRLMEDGWTRVSAGGSHWWSRSYTRTST